MVRFEDVKAFGPCRLGQAKCTFYADKVLEDGKLVGIKFGSLNSYYYRQMISLCTIDVEYSDIDTKVIVVWGDPGTRQKEIHAVVSRFPYLNENRNEDVDVSKIPHPWDPKEASRALL